MARTRDPRTKEELLDRMLSYDFDGDIRHLGAEEATIQRAAPNAVWLRFPDSGRSYLLSVRLPRGQRKPRLAPTPTDYLSEANIEDEIDRDDELERDEADDKAATAEMAELVEDLATGLTAEPAEDRKGATFPGNSFRALIARANALADDGRPFTGTDGEGEAGDGSTVGEGIGSQSASFDEMSRRRQRRAA